ncbi:MAG: hypothetical protein H6Q66_840 [Firmicutes bacterium]|nr:hypothetical protein [Bacillota bacterium]
MTDHIALFGNHCYIKSRMTYNENSIDNTKNVEIRSIAL